MTELSLKPVDDYKIKDVVFAKAYVFSCRGHTFFAHNFIDARGVANHATWQFSHNHVPVTFIQMPDVEQAVREFRAMASVMGDQFEPKLRTVVAGNYQKMARHA